jgi:DNA-binding transcriptional regulator YdaS (Cro superfamily)
MNIDKILDKAGGQAHVAREIGVSPQAVLQWRLRGKVPAERVLALERITGVSRTVWRPDIYPADE